MSKTNKGGLVHPLFRAPEAGQWYISQGMNRRDLGALEIAAAMAAAVRGCGESPDPQQIAEFSYKLSDALIKEGEK